MFWKQKMVDELGRSRNVSCLMQQQDFDTVFRMLSTV